MPSLKQYCKAMYEPLDAPINQAAVELFVETQEANQKLARQAAEYLFKKATGSTTFEIRVKTGYLLVSLMNQCPERLSVFMAELGALGVATQSSGGEFHFNSVSQTYKLLQVLKQQQTPEVIEQTIVQYTMTLRAYVGFIAGLESIQDNPALSTQDIEKQLLIYTFRRLGQLLVNLVRGQQQGVHIYKLRPNISDLNLCMNQLKDCVHLIGKSPEEISDIMKEIQDLFNSI